MCIYDPKKEVKLLVTETKCDIILLSIFCIIFGLINFQESLKVEMSITEAKYESAQRSLEADLHSQMEKEVSSALLYIRKIEKHVLLTCSVVCLLLKILLG